MPNAETAPLLPEDLRALVARPTEPLPGMTKPQTVVALVREIERLVQSRYVEPIWWTVLRHDFDRQAWTELGEVRALTGEEALRAVVFGSAVRPSPPAQPLPVELGTYRAVPLLHCRDLSVAAKFGATPDPETRP